MLDADDAAIAAVRKMRVVRDIYRGRESTENLEWETDKINERVRVFADARESVNQFLHTEEHGAAALTGPSNGFPDAYVFILITPFEFAGRETGSAGGVQRLG